MKKIFFTFIFLFLTTFCFANTEEYLITSDSFRTAYLALQDEIIMTLEVSNSDTFVASAIEDLSSASQSQRNAELEKNKQKEAVKKNKLKNKPYQFACFGVSASISPINLELSSADFTNFAFGLFYQPILVYNIWTFKGSVGGELFKNYQNEAIFSLYILGSLGISPLHNDYLYLAIYGTYCFETMNGYTYHSAGGSLTFGFKCSNIVFAIINLDATYRFTENFDTEYEDIIPMNSLYGTWRFAPSISIALKLPM